MSNRSDNVRHRALLATFGAVAGLAAFAGNASADVCFADTGLDVTNNYQTTLITFGNGGTCVSSQQPTGGNPATFLRVDTTVNNAPAGARSGVDCVFLFNGAIYDPSISGQIMRICYEEWVYMIQGAGDVQGTGPVIRQVDGSGNLTYYKAVPSLIVGTGTSWSRRAVTLEEADFSAIDPSNPITGLDRSRQPDFSKHGAPMEFGFFRSNNTSLGGGGYSRSAAIDSWSITIISECFGDLNKDGFVDFGDILVVLANWGPC